jgi:hypothetical protein
MVIVPDPPGQTFATQAVHDPGDAADGQRLVGRASLDLATLGLKVPCSTR